MFALFRVINYTEQLGMVWSSLIFCVPGLIYFCYLFGLYNGLLPSLMNSMAELLVQVRMRFEDLNKRYHELSDEKIVEELISIIHDHQVALE